jgi:hypothetical protein
LITDDHDVVSVAYREDALAWQQDWACRRPILSLTEGILQMRLSHTRPVTAATFDEPNLVSAAGVVPVLRLAQDGGLGRLASELLTVPSDRG